MVNPILRLQLLASEMMGIHLGTSQGLVRGKGVQGLLAGRPFYPKLNGPRGIYC